MAKREPIAAPIWVMCLTCLRIGTMYKPIIAASREAHVLFFEQGPMMTLILFSAQGEANRKRQPGSGGSLKLKAHLVQECEALQPPYLGHLHRCHTAHTA